ncbi:helix-turn-helix transcriptional regulator [Actinophytocola gossypii]|uniref:AAA family ATPase n=1 Tax=Actinophytocola gossypii TaxID=2812003 RepID=A0ABT2JCR8_9PSEU|nr:LuxR family transcriptional regulator [Actinophytocola gossypii]MCT2585334.1 AAA family ATPase [Actinophytocola gossypii]
MLAVARLGSGIALVARDRELGRLRAALEGAAAGTAAAVLVSGDAGVGKTRLTEELAALARESDALVLTGRCLDAGETGLPYLPFVEAMAQLPDREHSVRAHPALARLLPDLAPVAGVDARDGGMPGMDAVLAGVGARSGAGRPERDIGQLQLFDAVHGLLTDLAADRCVVLVLEDLHWADTSTRALLAFLVSRLRTQRLLIVGTYRGDDLHRRHPLRPLLAELVRLPATERLDLTPFGEADSRVFVAELADEALPEDVVREVAGRSEGNAFFAEELVAAYSARADDVGGVLPATLVDVLLNRVERLSEPAQRVIRVASVAGRRAGHATLLDVAELAEPDLEEALREAVQHHVLVARQDQGVPVYAFRHALMREAVYGDLLPGERVRLHGAYATRLAGRRGHRGVAAALAHHSMESHQLPQALAASVEAAYEAKAAGAPTESLHHLERALKLWDAVPEADRPADTDEAALLRQASHVAGGAGEPERAVAFARQAVKLVDRTGADPELAAMTRRRLASALFVFDGREDESRAVIERAWELARDLPASCEKAWVLAVYASILRGTGDPVDARTYAQLAVRDARAAGEPGVEADALVTLAALDEEDGQLEQSRDRLREAQRLALLDGAPTVELRARHYLGLNHYEHGDLDGAVRVIDEGVERARDTGLTWGSYGFELRALKVLSRYARGDWDESEAAAEPPGRRVSGTVSARIAAVGSHVMIARGRLAEAARLVTELRAEWHRDFQIVASMGAASAELALWRNRPRDGLTHLRTALEWVERLGGSKWTLVNIRLGALGVALCAEVAAAAGRRRGSAEAEAERRAAVEEGRALLGLVRDTARHGRPRTGKLGPEGLAWLARAEAEASRLDGAGDPELWLAAVDAFGYGAVYEQAVCRWRLGDALLRADRRADAGEALRAAEEVASRLGAQPLRDAVRALARRGRLRLGDGPEPRETLDPFTPRERSVLALVALGRTNRQVGAELYISEKTVSVHLSRIMAKLGATRRTEAVAMAYDRGLLDDPAPA